MEEYYISLIKNTPEYIFIILIVGFIFIFKLIKNFKLTDEDRFYKKFFRNLTNTIRYKRNISVIRRNLDDILDGKKIELEENIYNSYKIIVSIINIIEQSSPDVFFEKLKKYKSESEVNKDKEHFKMSNDKLSNEYKYYQKIDKKYMLMTYTDTIINQEMKKIEQSIIKNTNLSQSDIYGKDEKRFY